MTDETIHAIPLFSHIDTALFRQHLAEHRVWVRHYQKGMTVHRQNEPCHTLDVVLSGDLAAYSLLENGSGMTLFEFRRNSIIGANLLFGEQHAYPLNFCSTSDCSLLHVTRTAVLDFLHEYHFVLQYIRSLSQNAQGMNRKITMFTQKTLRENLLDYLRQLSILQKSDRIILPISKKELADHLGVQRPSLFRVLKKLQEEQILEINNRFIRIL